MHTRRSRLFLHDGCIARTLELRNLVAKTRQRVRTASEQVDYWRNLAESEIKVTLRHSGLTVWQISKSQQCQQFLCFMTFHDFFCGPWCLCGHSNCKPLLFFLQDALSILFYADLLSIGDIQPYPYQWYQTVAFIESFHAPSMFLKSRWWFWNSGPPWIVQTTASSQNPDLRKLSLYPSHLRRICLWTGWRLSRHLHALVPAPEASCCDARYWRTLVLEEHLRRFPARVLMSRQLRLSRAETVGNHVFCLPARIEKAEAKARDQTLRLYSIYKMYIINKVITKKVAHHSTHTHTL